jgi:hypothetical protein
MAACLFLCLFPLNSLKFRILPLKKYFWGAGLGVKQRITRQHKMASEDSESDVELDGMDLENQEVEVEVEEDDGVTAAAVGTASFLCFNPFGARGEQMQARVAGTSYFLPCSAKKLSPSETTSNCFELHLLGVILMYFKKKCI